MDLKSLEIRLAEYKVYNAWQYCESLSETLGYMNLSYELIKHIQIYRSTTLKEEEQRIFNEAINLEKSSITSESLNITALNLNGYKINDIMFLKKLTLEFFHYARLSIDIIYQIINAGLLGDSSFEVTDSQLIINVDKEIKTKQNFQKLSRLLNSNFRNDNYKYLMAFDNYVKHIKTILLTIKNSFLIGNNSEFKISTFRYKKKIFSECDAFARIEATNNYILKTVDTILNEFYLQIPNCIDTYRRIQELKFKMQIEKSKNNVDFLYFYIEAYSLSELPQEIKVLPLLIKPNNEIYSFDFKFDKIFIKKKGIEGEDNSIIGCANIVATNDSNEFYKTFRLNSCNQKEFFEYNIEFSKKHPTISINFFALQGDIIAYNSKDLK